ncbi:unnamed protein product [Alternaria alternata]
MSSSGGDIGSAKEGSSNSLSSLVSTLVPTAILAFAFVAAFFIARKYFRRVYAPRTYLNHLGQQRQTPAPSPGFFGWIKDFKNLKDEYILDHQSIDGYLFVRFFKVLIITCFLGCLVTWPVLFPVNATGGAGQEQLDLLSMSNVDPAGTNVNRYYAHAGISFIFLSMVMAIIARESFYVVNLRQAYRRSPWGASRLSSRTILFTNVPTTMSQSALFEMFPGVKHAWVASNTKELDDLVEDRDKTAMKLEEGEIQLSRDANTNRMKAEKGKKHFVASDLKFLIGKKVDTIEYGRSHLAELLPKIQQEQDKHWNGQGDLVGAVFLEFDTQKHAQDAWQMMQSSKTRPDKKLKARQLGVMPQEVAWGNLRIKPIGAPLAFVGLISNINYLADRFTWLEWILDIPKVILGVVTGLLPAVMLAVLMALVPIVCRLMAKLAGYVTYSQIELKCQSWYFAFQVVQVFLVATLSSAITSVINQVLDNPSIVLNLLATNLPKASNFYISYFILLGLSSAAGTLLNIGGFVVVVLLGRILPGKTPRKIFEKLTKLSAPSWGSEYPKWVNLAVIGITYSGIAPLILGFATVGFTLIYIAFRYNFLYVYETNLDTKGHIEDGMHAQNGEKVNTTDATPSYAPKPTRMPMFLRKMFNPEKHSIHNLSASLDQFYHQPQEPLPIEIQKRAFFNPSVTSPTPVLWIVRDDMGISQREIRDTQKIVPGLIMTDEQATFNEKGKVSWDGVENGHSREAPVFDERIVY